MGKSAPVINPIKEIRQRLGLTQIQLAQRIGRARATVSDAEHARLEAPPVELFKRLQRYGLLDDLSKVIVQYRASRAGLGSEWLTSDEEPKPNLPATNPLAPSHPLQQFLDFNDLDADSLRKRLGRNRCSVIDKILNRTAPLKVAAEFFQSLRWALPIEWGQARLGDNAVAIYAAVVAYYKPRDDDGWQTWMQASQPREAGE